MRKSSVTRAVPWAFRADSLARPIWPQDAAAEAKRPVYGGVFMRVKQMYLGANRPPRLT
jgi:hypothetical protein